MGVKRVPSPNNIWGKEGFQMCGLGEKCKLIAKIKHMRKCIRWSYQRITRGYADCDWWDMYSYLQRLLPDMLQDMRDHRNGSPAYLGENYTNEAGILVNDTCHQEWDKILDCMIYLWKESDEDTCSRKNPYGEACDKAREEFETEYGFWGEKLQTDEETEETRKNGSRTIHTMSEVPKYKEISDKYFEEERKMEEYRRKCKDEAMDMLKEHFYALWD